MKKLIGLLVVLSTLTMSSAFAEYKRACGTLYVEGNSFRGYKVELEVRRGRVYRLTGLSDTHIQMLTDGGRYCAAGNVEIGFTGKKEMRVTFIEEE